MIRNNRMRTIILLWCCFAGAAHASDYAREQKWADEVVPGIVVGEPVYLEADHHRFLAIHTPVKNSAAALIIVHGLGVHPDWGMIGTLRTELAQTYTTLAIQMPILASDAKPEAYPPTFAEAAARLAAAVKYLQSHGTRRIVVVSHSMGSRMSDYYFAHHPSTPVSMWVALGMLEKFSILPNRQLKVLDLYGENDFPQVLDNAAARQKILSRQKCHKQQVIPGADHFFNGKETELVGAVKSFIAENSQVCQEKP